jgi:large subunit ribosomal protein L10
MNREEKAAAVKEIAAELGDASALFAIDYRGISVTQAAELRARLRAAETSFTVVKNRLAKRAAAEIGNEGLEPLFEGPTAIAFVKGDPVIAAKAISTFARENQILTYKGGFMDGNALEPDAFHTIARLPGVETLRGQLVGLTASPLTGLASGLNNLVSGIARQLSQIAEQGLVSGEVPAAPADEAAASAEEEGSGEGTEEEGSDQGSEEEGQAEDEEEASGEGSEEEAPAEQQEETSDEDRASNENQDQEE